MDIIEGAIYESKKEDRIDPFCKKVASIWKKTPYLRFGQMLYDFFNTEYNLDPFYVNDDELIDKFEKYIDRVTSAPSNDNRCVICGEIIPEGKMVCMACEMKM